MDVLVKRHGKDGHTVLPQATRSATRAFCLHELNDYGQVRKACVFHDLNGDHVLQAFRQSDAVKEPTQCNLKRRPPSERCHARLVNNERK